MGNAGFISSTVGFRVQEFGQRFRDGIEFRVDRVKEKGAPFALGILFGLLKDLGRIPEPRHLITVGATCLKKHK